MESALNNIEVPSWVPPEHRSGYRQIAVEAGEEEAAAWARHEKQGGWTDGQVETLRSSWGRGLSAARIASELGGISRAAVVGKLHRLGLVSGERTEACRHNQAGWTKEQVERLRSLRAKQYSASQIAAELGISRSAVLGKLHRLGLTEADHARPAHSGGRAALGTTGNASTPPLSGEAPDPPPALASVRHVVATSARGAKPAAAVRPPATEARMLAEAAEESGVDIMGLRSCHCRWIVAGWGAQARYCGQDRPNPKRPYCEFHEAVATGSRAAAE